MADGCPALPCKQHSRRHWTVWCRATHAGARRSGSPRRTSRRMIATRAASECRCSAHHSCAPLPSSASAALSARCHVLLKASADSVTHGRRCSRLGGRVALRSVCRSCRCGDAAVVCIRGMCDAAAAARHDNGTARCCQVARPRAGRRLRRAAVGGVCCARGRADARRRVEAQAPWACKSRLDLRSARRAQMRVEPTLTASVWIVPLGVVGCGALSLILKVCRRPPGLPRVRAAAACIGTGRGSRESRGRRLVRAAHAHGHAAAVHDLRRRNARTRRVRLARLDRIPLGQL